MDNPWKNFDCKNESMVLPVDREAIDRYNSRQRSKDKKVVLRSIPAPFIGDRLLARLVLLNLNPGHEASDFKDQRDPDFQRAVVLTLKHKLREFPFYPLNPAFSHTGAARWWNKKLDQLRLESKLDNARLSQMIMVIEWFPYHSKKSMPEKLRCESQKYSFHLAKQMLNKPGVIIVGMRSQKRWCESIPEFEKVSFLNSPQCACVSRGNMSGRLFDGIIERLRQ